MTEFSDDVEHVLVFHDEYYISSTLPHEEIQPLYAYLVGCGESYREGPPGYFRPLKVHTYKDSGNTYKVTNEEVKEEQTTSDEDKLGVTSFCKINQRYIGAPVSPKALGFLIGPVFESGD